MKRNKGGEVRCKHEACITWDTTTEYGEWVKCIKCGHEMPKHNWIVLQELGRETWQSRLKSWIKNIEPFSIDAALAYFIVYLLVMLAYGYYSL